MSEKRCPTCNGKVILRETNPDLYFCGKCKMLTDCEDDGGVGRGNPANNASNKEEFENREKARKFRRARSYKR